MLQIAASSTQKVIQRLADDSGLPAAVEALISDRSAVLSPISQSQIVSQNVAADLSEKSTMAVYPLFYVYCNRIVNDLREKFRSFSGDAQMVIEARVSYDRLDHIESSLQGYVAAITQVLASNRGDWGDGVFFDGGYDVTFTGIKHGGRNFVQTAKISFALEISAG